MILVADSCKNLATVRSFALLLYVFRATQETGLVFHRDQINEYQLFSLRNRHTMPHFLQ